MYLVLFLFELYVFRMFRLGMFNIRSQIKSNFIFDKTSIQKRIEKKAADTSSTVILPLPLVFLLASCSSVLNIFISDVVLPMSVALCFLK